MPGPSATSGPSILIAEGQRQSSILSAGGEKESAILRAQGDREAAVLRAQADRQAQMLRAEGEAQAISTVFGAIHAGQPDQALLAYQYMQMLPSIARGDANKVWIVPSELNDALKGLGNAVQSVASGIPAAAKGEFSAPPEDRRPGRDRDAERRGARRRRSAPSTRRSRPPRSWSDRASLRVSEQAAVTAGRDSGTPNGSSDAFQPYQPVSEPDQPR